MTEKCIKQGFPIKSLNSDGKKNSRNLFFVINHKDMFVVALKFLNFATFYI